MSKILCIVESPAKAKSISKILGSDYLVRATAGHVQDLYPKGKNYLGIDLDGFIPFYSPIPEKIDKVNSIKDALTHVEEVYIASDPDREGEAIAFHIAELLKTSKPIHRVHFHEITKKGIQKGIQNLQQLNQNLYDAQQARRILDRLVGYLVSPIVIQLFGPSLSAGRVQSVAVRLVAEREKEIQKFKAEEYWNIFANFEKDKQKFSAKYQGKINNEKSAQIILKELETAKFVVSEVLAEEKHKIPPAPLITSTLQQVAAKKLHFPAAKTMKLAQTLYEAGLVTYIRTDSVRSSPEGIEAARDYLTANSLPLPSQPNLYKTKDGAQDAHEAIRPTDLNRKISSLFITDEEKRLYSLIWKYFLASQSIPAIYDTVSVSISAKAHIFKAAGKSLRVKGWLEILEDKEESDDILPVLSVSEILIPQKPFISEQKFTLPPSRFKEHSLIKELEKRGIGRPATYAPIMQKLTERGYVEKKKDSFVATELGIKVVDKLVEFFKFLEYQYTANLEEELDKIAEGKLTYLEFLNNFYEGFSEELFKIRCSFEKDYGILCEKCIKPMRLKNGTFGPFLSCDNYPKCKFVMDCEIIDGKVIPKLKKSVEPVPGIKCPNCEAPMVTREGTFGRFLACTRFPLCFGKSKLWEHSESKPL